MNKELIKIASIDIDLTDLQRYILFLLLGSKLIKHLDHIFNLNTNNAFS